MGNFPIKEIQEEWLVELIRDTYPPTPLYYEDLINCEVDYNGTVQLIPNYLYKWDKGTVPPVVGRWIAFTPLFKSANINPNIDDYWEDGILKYFMILEDEWPRLKQY